MFNGGVYLNELNMIVFMVYVSPPNQKNVCHGDMLQKSFKYIVIDNIYVVMSEYQAPTSEILLLWDVNFP